MGRLEGKVALITGASKGMGAAAAQLFAREGAKVVCIARSQEGLDEVVKSIKDEGNEACAVAMDVTIEKDWERAVETAISNYGKIDILVNNAGVRILGDEVETCPTELFDQILSINARGVFFGMRAVVPYMRKNGGGSIINTGSGLAIVGGDNAIGYAASKGGVRAMTKNAAATLGKDNIRVNCVHPGFIFTDLIKSLGIESFEVCASMMEGRTPLPPYVGHPIDVAYAYLFFASDESKYITAAELTVDGGDLSV